MKAQTANLKIKTIEVAAKAAKRNPDFSRENLEELMKRFDAQATGLQKAELAARLQKL